MAGRFETFTAALTQIYRSVQKLKSMEMTELGLKGGHVMWIFYLYRHPEGLTASELCVLCDEDKASVSRSASELEARGLITCLQDDGRKKYRAKMSLTDAGKKVAAQLEQVVERDVARGGSGLTEEQRNTFYNALLRISENLRNFCREREDKV